MAKQPKRRPDAGELPDELEPGDVPDIDVAGVEALLQQLGEAPAEAKVHVNRIRTGGVRPPFAFLYATTAAEFSIEDLKARYGGGEFLIRVWQRGHAGFLINERISIEGPPIIEGPAVPPASAHPGAPVFNFPPQQGGFAELARVMAEGFRSQNEMLLAVIGKPRDSLADIERMGAVFGIVRQAMGGGGIEGGGIAGTLGLVSQIMSIVREAEPVTGKNGHADAWSVLQAAAEKILPAIIERAGAPQLGGPGPIPQLGLRPGAPPAPAGPTTLADHAKIAAEGPRSAPGSGNGGGGMDMRAVLGALLQGAQGNRDPEPFASYVLAQLDIQADPNKAADELQAFLESPGWFTELCRAVPTFAQHQAWLTRFHAVLLAELRNVEDLTEGEGDGISGPEGAFYSGAPGSGS